MKTPNHSWFALTLSASLFAGCGGSQPPIGAAGAMPQWQATHAAHQACSSVRRGDAQCLVLIQDKAVSPDCVGEACGWGPIDFQTRYKLPITRGSGQIVAIVDANDNPNVASDLIAYRSHFGLGSVTFKKYNQNGQQSNYPPPDLGWGLEEDLDVDMVSAACPKCTIYLIEANSSNVSDFEAAEDTAANLTGVHITSNSWICYGSDDCGDPNFSNHFDKAGVEYVAALGDAGYDQNGAPEALDTVTSVGGTQLSKGGSTYSESFWNGSGGGCSNNGGGGGVPKPKWQSIIPDSVCAYRITPDAAAEAGCSPGVAEYDSYGYSGWLAVCGTSAAAPLLAGVFGLAGNATKQDGGRTFWRPRHHKHLYYINGQCQYRLGQYTTCGGWGLTRWNRRILTCRNPLHTSAATL